MDKSSWSSFIKRIPITSSVKKVYNAWASQEGLESWFLRKAEFIKPDKSQRQRDSLIQKGDKYEWYWHGYGDNVNEKREVIDANDKDKLSFIFSGNCLVTVQIKQHEDFILCQLTQENIPEDDNPRSNLFVGCGEGWTFYLANLKSILEGGIDLRNKDLSITGIINS